MDGTVEQGAGLVAANAIGGDSSVTLLEEVQPGGVTTGDDAER